MVRDGRALPAPLLGERRIDMYSWCTREEFLDDYFDTSYVFSERGAFASYNEAVADAEKHGYERASIIVLNASD